MSEVTIRLAQKEDATVLFDMIKGLAEYEKMSDEVTGSVQLLEKNIFEKGIAEALLAEIDSKVVGVAIFFTGFSTFTCKGTIYLEDVFVLEEYRNKGIGKKFFSYLADLAKERDYTRFEWVCLDWNQPSIDFYEQRLKAKALKEWIRFRLDGEELDTLAERLENN